MKVWKKFSAIALTLVMALALCAPAFAAPTPVDDGDMEGDGTEDGSLGEFTNEGEVVYTYTNKDVILYKEITAYNQAETTVNAPTITYKYTVTSGAATYTDNEEDKPYTITDKFDVPVNVKAGITDNVAISGAVSKDTSENPAWSYSNNDGTLAFTPAVQLSTTSGGAKNAFPIKVDFSNVVFTGAGVYRYVITETVNGAEDATDAKQTAAKNAAGIADGTISNVRYLDVYVKDGTPNNGNPTYDIYGFVCFQNLESAIDGTLTDGTASTANNVTKIAKTEGFVADKSGTNTDLTADAYYTFNVTVSKTVVNDQAQNNNEFPFQVNITNSSVTAAITLKTKTVEDGNTAVAGSDKSGTLSATTSETLTGISDTPTIDHESNIKYIGIPVGITGATSVAVYETNNVTGTTYSSNYVIDSTTNGTAKTITWNNTGDANKSNTATLTSTVNAKDTTDHTIAFTNTLLNISPTGVTLRYAPYLAMMGAGIVALPLSLRKKEELF